MSVVKPWDVFRIVDQEDNHTLQREESHALQEIHKGRKGKARAMKTLLELV